MNVSPRIMSRLAVAAFASLAALHSAPAQTNDSFRDEVVRLTNAERAKFGLTPLAKHNQLARAAQKHAESMAKDDFFSHTGKDGSSPSDRASREGYQGGAGENVAAGYAAPKDVVDGWMSSPGHRANILRPEYRAMGVGYFKISPDPGSVTFGTYWVQVFGISTAGANQGSDGGSGGGGSGGGGGPSLVQGQPVVVAAGAPIRHQVQSSGAIRRFVARGNRPQSLRFNEKRGRFVGTINTPGNYRFRVVGRHASGRTNAIRVVFRVR